MLFGKGSENFLLFGGERAQVAADLTVKAVGIEVFLRQKLFEQFRFGGHKGFDVVDNIRRRGAVELLQNSVGIAIFGQLLADEVFKILAVVLQKRQCRTL